MAAHTPCLSRPTASISPDEAEPQTSPATEFAGEDSLSIKDPGVLWRETLATLHPNRLRAHGFLRNVLVVMTGTAAAQLIGFAFSPLLSRLYGPADFAGFGAFASIQGVLSAAATLNYADALMLPPGEDKAAPLFLLACLSTAVITLATVACCLLAPDWFLRLLRTDHPGWYLWLLPVSVLVDGLGQSLTSWCSRLKAFKTTSQAQVIRSTVVCASQTGGGAAGLGGAGLVGGAILADSLAAVFLARGALVQGRALFAPCARWPVLRRMAWEYRQFAVYGCPQNVINALSQGIPVLSLAHYYGAAVAGSYAFGLRLLLAPMNFILTPVRQVLYQRLSRVCSAGGDLLPSFLKSTGVLFAISLPPCCVAFLAAPRVFAFIFGARWREAGEFARWLVFWLIPAFCNVPSTLVGRVLRLQRGLFWFDVTLLCARAAALVLGGVWLQPLHTIIAFSLVGAFFNAAFVGYVAVRLRRSRAAARA